MSNKVTKRITDDGRILLNIQGAEYETVPSRVNRFINDCREEGKSFLIDFEILERSPEAIAIRCTISVDGKITAVGHAEERRDQGYVNATSALENCETSAAGRALAFMGYAGSELATANEMHDALVQRAELFDGQVEYMKLVREKWQFISHVKDRIADNDLAAAIELCNTETHETLKKLWKAPTKGGVWSTAERETMKSDEWSATRESMK